MEKQYIDVFQDELLIDAPSQLSIHIHKQARGSLFIVVQEDVQISIVMDEQSSSHILFYNKNQDKLKLDIHSNLKKDAECKMGFLDMETDSVSLDLKTVLDEPGAHFELMTGQLGQENTIKHNNIEILHKAGYTQGLMQNFAVLFDKADYQMVANGNIKKGCSQAQSHQVTRVLTLGKDHKAKVIPLLLIDENDVKASHAQTIGQPDEDQLYYLKSRGLSHRQALGLLSIGYLLPVLDLMDNESKKEELRQEMENKVGLYGNRENS